MMNKSNIQNQSKITEKTNSKFGTCIGRTELTSEQKKNNRETNSKFCTSIGRTEITFNIIYYK